MNAEDRVGRPLFWACFSVELKYHFRFSRFATPQKYRRELNNGTSDYSPCFVQFIRQRKKSCDNSHFESSRFVTLESFLSFFFIDETNG